MSCPVCSIVRASCGRWCFRISSISVTRSKVFGRLPKSRLSSGPRALVQAREDLVELDRLAGLGDRQGAVLGQLAGLPVARVDVEVVLADERLRPDPHRRVAVQRPLVLVDLEAHEPEVAAALDVADATDLHAGAADVGVRDELERRRHEGLGLRLAPAGDAAARLDEEPGEDRHARGGERGDQQELAGAVLELHREASVLSVQPGSRRSTGSPT
jgi:hypothetical protein